jgi:hypothetical protein
MSRVTAAFVCALCDPDNPRPASIMCSNNCGRYVCAAHAVPRKGPGSAMICQSCAEALGLLDKPKPKPAPEVRPLIEIPPEPAPAPQPEEVKTEPISVAVPAAAAAAAVKDETPAPPPLAAPPLAEQVTIVTPPVTPPPAKEPIVIDSAASSAAPGEPRSAVRLTDTGPAPKSTASETVVSQRGSTLQVPKVTPSLGKPPQPIAPQPRKAQRAGNGGGRRVDWTLIAMIAGTVVLGMVGFVMILAALAG